MRIIVDAFGGDNAPLEVLRGCAMAVKEYGVDIIACGSEKIIREVCQKNRIPLDRISITDVEKVIPVEVDPTEVVKSYDDCTMAVGMKMLASGEGDAFVSAGSTGAIVVGASLFVKRIKGIKRAALATVIPSQDGCYMLLDMGANAECRPEMLVQFGIMGSAYMEHVLGIERPRVGIINIGAEENKGLELQIDAYRMMQHAPVNFVGNVEPRDLPFTKCDVAIADGFVGNVVLKLTEGLGSWVFEGAQGHPLPKRGLQDRRGLSEQGRALLQKEDGLHRVRRRAADGHLQAGHQGARQLERKGVQKRDPAGEGVHRAGRDRRDQRRARAAPGERRGQPDGGLRWKHM